MRTINKAKLELTLSRFDFERVRRFMRKVDWAWGASKQIPEVYEIEILAERLLERVYESATSEECDFVGQSACGGLVARYYNKDNTFELEFVLETSDSYIEGEESSIEEVEDTPDDTDDVTPLNI